MALKTWHACILSAGAVAAAFVMSSDRGANAQVGGAPHAGWHVTVIERSTLQTAERVVRDAMLVDTTTGQTWILTKHEGENPTWVAVLRKN